MRDYSDWSSIITVEERTRFFSQPMSHCFLSNSLIDVKDITLMTSLGVRHIWKSENNFNSGHRCAQEIMNFSLSRARCYTVGEVWGNGGPSFSKEECWEPPSVGWIGEGCQKTCKDDGKWILDQESRGREEERVKFWVFRPPRTAAPQPVTCRRWRFDGQILDRRRKG
ncbi:hypothetical protein J1N35_042969 [Gossypium stocksii]|uniref:Uncharacterized protein n=1 Tax=Gossypium stocksii TaxID=47602 RepID=A0A9D3U6K3_9ROSI|nr:hypothetical protein J1N35_042969 [Gossypium stocksii]